MKKYRWFTLLLALTLAFGVMSIGQADIIPARGEGQIGLQAIVLCESLTVRQEPTVSSAAVKTLYFGDVIIVQPETGGWAACFLSDDVDSGRAGWVNEAYLAIDPALFRTEEQTPVYAWNDTAAPRVALLDKDTLLPILKIEGNWIVVSLRGAAGWIYYANQTGRQNGERFDATIMLEGMVEPVRYEHIVNAGLGIEMDYDYEIFQRRSEADRECFFSIYDSSREPLDYLEITFSAQDADSTAASICETLSTEYDIFREPHALANAGSCIMINASRVKGTNMMPDLLQTVYVIPAANGCIVASEHCTIESAEGFGARIGNMMNTLAVIGSQAQ